jgi:choline-sulfatase
MHSVCGLFAVTSPGSLTGNPFTCIVKEYSVHRVTKVTGVRSGIWGVLCLAAAAVLVARCGAGNPGARPERIVLITLDTCRADRLGAYGGPSGLTPRLDELAGRGTVYANAFTTAPLTLPAHASLFSGLFPFRHGARVNGTDSVGPAVPLVQEELREAGYGTGAFVASVVVGSSSGMARGFDHFDERFAENENRRYGEWVAERPGSEVVDRALTWMDAAGQSSSFVWVHLYDAHAPYEGSYDEEIGRLDREVGRIVDALRERGVDRKTLIIVAGDHGESLGEHGESTHGIFLYDSTLRIPLIVVRPGQQRAERVRAPVSLVDLAPTLRDAAGISARDGDGVSLWKAAPAERRAVYAESTYAAALIGWSPLRALRTLKHKYVEAPRPELYDLERDPAELTNIVGSGIEPARRLPRMLAGLLRTAVPAAGDRSRPDPEAMRQLASLGYLAPSSAAIDPDHIDASLPDPKDRIATWDQIERGIIARQSGNHAEAVDLLEAALRAEPNAPTSVLRELALSLRRTRRIDRALEIYAHLTSRPDAIADDYAGLGISEHLASNTRAAIAAYRRAVQLDPRHESAWINLGQELLAVGELDGAEEAFAGAARANQRSVDGLSGLAAVAFERRDYAAARMALQQALAIDPSNAHTKENLALVMRASNKERTLLE